MIKLKIMQVGEPILQVKAGGYKEVIATQPTTQIQIFRGNTLYETEELPYTSEGVHNIEQAYS